MGRLFLFAVLLLLVGCVSKGPSGTSFFRGDVAGEPPQPRWSPGEAADPRPDDEDDQDTSAPLSPVDWDASPPSEDHEGWLIEATLVCGLLDGAAAKAWVKGEGRWDEVPVDSPVRFVEGLEACATDSEKLLFWREDDSIYFEAAGMGHWLEPSATADLWGGEVQPLGEVTPACDEAMARHGLSWPVPLSLRLDALTSPDGAPAS